MWGKQRRREKRVGELWLDGTTGKVVSAADGRETCMCIGVCVCVIFASRTPFPASPACPPTQHMSSSPLLSSSPILPIITHFVVSFLSVFCVSIDVGGMRDCALCAPLQFFSDVFISINTHIHTLTDTHTHTHTHTHAFFTLQPNSHQRGVWFRLLLPRPHMSQ